MNDYVEHHDDHQHDDHQHDAGQHDAGQHDAGQQPEQHQDQADQPVVEVSQPTEPTGEPVAETPPATQAQDAADATVPQPEPAPEDAGAAERSRRRALRSPAARRAAAQQAALTKQARAARLRATQRARQTRNVTAERIAATRAIAAERVEATVETASDAISTASAQTTGRARRVIGHLHMPTVQELRDEAAKRAPKSPSVRARVEELHIPSTVKVRGALGERPNMAELRQAVTRIGTPAAQSLRSRVPVDLPDTAAVRADAERVVDSATEVIFSVPTKTTELLDVARDRATATLTRVRETIHR